MGAPDPLVGKVLSLVVSICELGTVRLEPQLS